MTPRHECSFCGGQVVFEPDIQLIQCRKCRKKFARKKAVNGEVSGSESILPFAFSRRCFEDRALEWLLSDDKIPDDLADAAIFDSAEGFYVPMWFYSGSYRADWSASAGYNRMEEYPKWNEFTKKMETETRNVTDWRPCSGSVSGRFAILACAGWEKKLGGAITRSADSTTFKSSDLKPFDVMYGFGFRILEFSQDSKSVWDESGSEQLDNVVSEACSARVPGDSIKDLSYDVSWTEKTNFKLWVPFWIAQYKYKGEDYFIAMHGFNSGEIIGERPSDPAWEEAEESLDYKRLKFKNMISRRVFVGSIFSLKDLFMNLSYFGLAFYSLAFLLRKNPNPKHQNFLVRFLMNLGHFCAAFILSVLIRDLYIYVLKEYYNRPLTVENDLRNGGTVKICFSLMVVVHLISFFQTRAYLQQSEKN